MSDISMRDGKRITPDGRKNKIGLQEVARMDTVRVVVADDNIQLRDMVAEYLQEQNGIEVSARQETAWKRCGW